MKYRFKTKGTMRNVVSPKEFKVKASFDIFDSSKKTIDLVFLFMSLVWKINLNWDKND